jgi:hypothetical protein
MKKELDLKLHFKCTKTNHCQHLEFSLPFGKRTKETMRGTSAERKCPNTKWTNCPTDELEPEKMIIQ